MESNLNNNEEFLPKSPTLACERCFEKVTYLSYSVYKAVSQRMLNIPKKNNISCVPDQNKGDEKLQLIKKCWCEELTTDQPDVLTQEINSEEKLRDHMDTEPDNLTVTDETTNTEDANAVVCTNNYMCMCETCQNKFGSLPLLIQGIEQKSLIDNPPQPSTSYSPSSTSLATSRRSYECQYCSKIFSHKGDYTKHLRKHTKEQPFACPICNRKFAHTSNLQRHFRLHSGQKPYVCSNCQKRFSRKDKLECHKRSRLCQASTSFN